MLKRLATVATLVALSTPALAGDSVKYPNASACSSAPGCLIVEVDSEGPIYVDYIVSSMARAGLQITEDTTDNFIIVVDNGSSVVSDNGEVDASSLEPIQIYLENHNGTQNSTMTCDAVKEDCSGVVPWTTATFQDYATAALAIYQSSEAAIKSQVGATEGEVIECVILTHQEEALY